jgi:hypothetical protein
MSNLVTLKFQIRTVLTDFLYKPVEQRHRQEIEALIVQNCRLTNSPVRAFRYKGELYRADLAPRGPLMAPSLHPDLAMQLALTHEEQARIYREEQPVVVGYIIKVLNLTSNTEDYKKLLPSCVHAPLAFMDNYAHLNTWPVFTYEGPYEMFMAQHAPQIQLIKERMATNLLFAL